MVSRGELLGLVGGGEFVPVGAAILLTNSAENVYTVGPVVPFFTVVLRAYVGGGRD